MINNLIIIAVCIVSIIVHAKTTEEKTSISINDFRLFLVLVFIIIVSLLNIVSL